MPESPLTFRHANPDDADEIARLHADSWRRNYRGAYSDAFLDGDVVAERQAVWSARLRAPTGTETILAQDDDGLVGFIHLVLDDDLAWGSLIDNLHILDDRRRSGIGTELLRRAARAVQAGATTLSMYLWVLEQNEAAQNFYRACGGNDGETAPVPAPGGDSSRLNGSPNVLRVAWPDVRGLAATSN